MTESSRRDDMPIGFMCRLYDVRPPPIGAVPNLAMTPSKMRVRRHSARRIAKPAIDFASCRKGVGLRIRIVPVDPPERRPDLNVWRRPQNESDDLK